MTWQPDDNDYPIIVMVLLLAILFTVIGVGIGFLGGIR